MDEVIVMAYIPPISNNQYEQYAEREMKKDMNPFHIGHITRTNAAAGQPNATLSRGMTLKKTMKKKRSSILRVKQNRVNEATLSEVTGKGRYFNESI